MEPIAPVKNEQAVNSDGTNQSPSHRLSEYGHRPCLLSKMLASRTQTEIFVVSSSDLLLAWNKLGRTDVVLNRGKRNLKKREREKNEENSRMEHQERLFDVF
jgi:hypothetical protein